ncbi:MAG: O-antigen ligase family protein [Acidobacteria bacterium]|nr:MAG: O-antigen ligase family protein [Acidobacteriota bacterium]REK10147.1 MAG: O-antigen ligase family protein [Acidobacteriota bacterium]
MSAAAGQADAGAAPVRAPRIAVAATLGASLLAVLVVLVSASTLKEGFRAPKLWVLLFGAAAMIGCLAPLVAGREAARRSVFPLIALAPLVLVHLLASCFSRFPAISWETSVVVLLGALLVVLWTVLPLRFATLSITFGALAAAVSGWLFWNAVSLLSSAPSQRARFELRASLGNPADAAIFLLLPCIVLQARLRRRWIARADGGEGRAPGLLLEVLLAVTVHGGLLITQTLSAALALIAATLVLWWPRSLRTLSWRGAFAGLAVVALLVVAVLSTPLHQRVERKAEQMLRGDWNALLTGRLDGWMVAVELVRERPLLGQGPGNFGVLYNRTKEQLLAQGAPFYPAHGPFSSFANAHNEVLEVAAETGVLGVLALLWALGCLAVAARSAPPAHRRTALAGALGFAVVCLSYFPLRTPATALPVLVAVAWILSRRQPAPFEVPSPWRGGGVRVVAAVLLTAVLMLGVGRIVLPAAAAERALWLAEARASAFERGSGVQGSAAWRSSLQSLQRAFTSRPADARLPLAIGSYWLIAGDHERAEKRYRESLAIELRPETLLNLARALRGQGRDEEAAAAEARAVALDPYRRRALRRSG